MALDVKGPRKGLTVKGLDDIMEKLNAYINDVPFVTKVGLIEAGLLIQKDAQSRTPVDLGNLKASGMTVWKGKKAVPMPAWKSSRAKGASPKKKSSTEGPSWRRRISVGEDKVALLREGHTSMSSELKQLTGLSDDFWSPTVMVGFSAYYALWVHENLHVSHRVGEAQFLRRAVICNFDKILAVVKQSNVKAIRRAGRKKAKRLKGGKGSVSFARVLRTAGVKTGVSGRMGLPGMPGKTTIPRIPTPQSVLRAGRKGKVK